LGAVTPGLAGGSGGNADSTTYAAVSEGTIEIRNEQDQQQYLATLSRDPANANNPLSPIFDWDKILGNY
jgi:filamentous hemagglutinin